MFAEIFLLMYAAHLAADYPGQTDHQAAHKADPGAAGWQAAATHAGTHLIATTVMLGIGATVLGLTIPVLPATLALLWIAGTHAVIDRRYLIAAWMRAARQTTWAEHGGAAHVDQTAHVLMILVAALAVAS